MSPREELLLGIIEELKDELGPLAVEDRAQWRARELRAFAYWRQAAGKHRAGPANEPYEKPFPIEVYRSMEEEG